MLVQKVMLHFRGCGILPRHMPKSMALLKAAPHRAFPNHRGRAEARPSPWRAHREGRASARPCCGETSEEPQNNITRSGEREKDIADLILQSSVPPSAHSAARSISKPSGTAKSTQRLGEWILSQGGERFTGGTRVSR